MSSIRTQQIRIAVSGLDGCQVRDREGGGKEEGRRREGGGKEEGRRREALS